MADRDPVLFEHTVRNLLVSLGLRFREDPRVPFDFFVEDRNERRTAIEVRVGRIAQDEILRIGKGVKQCAKLIDNFYLATPQPPTERLSRLFAEAVKGSDVTTRWITANDIPVHLGADLTIDLDSPEMVAQLQTAALVSGIDRYSPEHIGQMYGPPRGQLRHWLFEIGSRRPQLPPGYETLSRHLSYASLEGLRGSDATRVNDILSLGSRVDDVTVVLSDIKNFSSIVRAARLGKIQGTMSKYYERSRRLVWKHGGTFDKFIGDATLSFYGYPYPTASACADAVRYAMDLVRMGSSVLGELTPQMNDVIETGTRVGIATGEVWVLNTGKGGVELAFIGDVINLAARLEKNCQTDGVLIDNITHGLLEAVEPDLVARLAAAQIIIPPEAAKGQNNPIRAWQISPVSVIAETGGPQDMVA